MEKIATDTFTFSKLRENGFTYVDKTERVLALVNMSMGSQFFCARPRRFGKSLLISTLQALFEGRRDLFKGLYIDTSDYDWKTYPVVRLDMGSCQADDTQELENLLTDLLNTEARRLHLNLEPSTTVPGLFTNLCRAAAEKSGCGKFVLLVDEYDKPLLGRLGTPAVTEIKNFLKKFYSVIKTQEGYQRFAFMTGVSKFSKVSIFSDLNNLTDITMDARFATMFGYTREEIIKNFPESIVALAEANGLTPDEAFARLETMYDGFKFHHAAERVFNPVSVGKCLSHKEFGSYWFETGTPTFLVNLLKENPLDEGEVRVALSDLSAAYEPEQVSMLPLMVQTGYLTIKTAEKLDNDILCTLGYPNFEVSSAMSKFVARGFSCLRDSEFSEIYERMFAGLRNGEIDEVMEGLKCFFENIPYDLHVKYEKYYQSLMLAVFLMLKARVATEVKTARGRIDAVVETPKFVYIFEFKLRGTSEEALAQIEEKGYATKFASDKRKLFKIGCAFDWEKRNLGEWAIA